MTVTAPRLILNPEASRLLRARYAPRFGEHPPLVTLGELPGFPMGRYYVHPDGSLTRPSDELRATYQNMRSAFTKIADAVHPTAAAIRRAFITAQNDYTKGA